MEVEATEINFNDGGLKPVYLKDCLVKKQVKVVVAGDPESEHNTYICDGNKCFNFYYDGYDGVSYEEIISLLKFLGHEVFVVYKNKPYKLDDNFEIVNWRDYI